MIENERLRKLIKKNEKKVENDRVYFAKKPINILEWYITHNMESSKAYGAVTKMC
jgi:hypothetical protein